METRPPSSSRNYSDEWLSLANLEPRNLDDDVEPLLGRNRGKKAGRGPEQELLKRIFSDIL